MATTPHKHAEVIKAWADGKQIQVMGVQGKWIDLEHDPMWTRSKEYRVKPETIRYRVALLFDVNGDGEHTLQVREVDEDGRCVFHTGHGYIARILEADKKVEI